jgi:hypothetical protein
VSRLGPFCCQSIIITTIITRRVHSGRPDWSSLGRSAAIRGFVSCSTGPLAHSGRCMRESALVRLPSLAAHSTHRIRPAARASRQYRWRSWLASACLADSACLALVVVVVVVVVVVALLLLLLLLVVVVVECSSWPKVRARRQCGCSPVRVAQNRARRLSRTGAHSAGPRCVSAARLASARAAAAIQWAAATAAAATTMAMATALETADIILEANNLATLATRWAPAASASWRSCSAGSFEWRRRAKRTAPTISRLAGWRNCKRSSVLAAAAAAWWAE